MDNKSHYTEGFTWQRVTASLAIMAWLVFFGWVLATRLQHAQAPPQKHPEAASEGALATARIYLGRETSSPPHAILSWQGEDGSTLWQGDVEISASGSIELTDDLLPRLPAKADSWPGRLAVEAPSHLSAAVDFRFRRAEDGSDVTIEPRSFSLYLEPLQPWLTFLLLMPALAVLWLAICHLRLHNHGTPAWFYALVCGGSWLLVSLGMAWVFVEHEQHLIPLFLADAQVSSGLVIFTFLGTLVYLTFSVYSREPEFFTHETSEPDRDRLLRTLGGRLLAAPYVSVVAWLLLSMIFPTLRSGPEVLFFGFFAGLWIKVVLDFLNRVGKNLLSQEALDRLKERHHRREAPELPPPPVRRAAYLPPPNPNYLAAIADARKELHGLEGVIGVGPGHRISQRDGQTDEPVITVYVAEKKELDSGDPNLVPPSFGGVRTDVVTPDMVIVGDCDATVVDLFWDKFVPDLDPEAAGDVSLDAAELAWEGDVLVLAHPEARGAFYVRDVLNHKRRFSPKDAYPAIRKAVGDSYDFIAFVLDGESIPKQNDYYIPVFNEASGIDFYLERPGAGSGIGFPAREQLGSSRLIGFQVHGSRHLRLRNLLHELGHAWLSYVPNGPQQYDLLDQQQKHWSYRFDDSFPWAGADGLPSRGVSCMGYASRRWNERPDGRFDYEKLEDSVEARPETSPFGFCSLELYLMGLIPPEEVGLLRLIDHRNELDGEPEPGRVYETPTIPIELSEIVGASGGKRKPPYPEARSEYRQLFVVVTANLDSGRARAKTVDRLRLDHARNVHLKTGKRLILRTERV